MVKRKSSMLEEIDSDLEFDNDVKDLTFPNHEEHSDDDQSDGENEDFSDEDFMDDNKEESEEENNEHAQQDEELEELEKERRELKNKERDVLWNLKSHKDEDVKKGQAVKSQLVLWDKTLEFKIMLQKPFTCSNRLPQEQVKSLFCDSDNGITEAYSNLFASSKKTLTSILELQKALIEKNPSITQDAEANMSDSKKLEDSVNTNANIDEEWLQISQMQTRMSSFRNKSIDKWHRKTQLTTGAAAIKDKLHAFNQSISEQVASYMRDPSKMIKGMQQNRSAVAVFGANVLDATDDVKPEDAYANGDPELLDDTDFYQQLLHEFITTNNTSSSSETTFYALKRMQTKKRKIVDRRASKSRKIRYNVHEKLVNFMAPRPVKKFPEEASGIFGNLFGLKSERPASAA